ncbi:hypothetical protein G3I44_14510 [Halogeometricum borinquense]|uniref:Uncharacterized protein n=1 Tax=Halogeometricum borinquense TaxID=60847 RepID=A0A6C0UNC4_9EURY|nr:hypothetical protein [Halogeometricum borinquense]QIB75399.1 hypothetical protein G3I44_14510 [Halogeometricum borinquense]
MGFEDLDDGEGYTQYGKGDNLYVLPTKIACDTGSYEGNTYKQLKCEFDAVPETGGPKGRVPAWISSRITIRGEEHSSHLATWLLAVEKLEEVLTDLGASEELIEAIQNGEKTYKAETDDENRALQEAVARHVGGCYVKAGSKFGGSGDDRYSKVAEFHEGVSKDDFEDAIEEGAGDEEDGDSGDAVDDASSDDAAASDEDDGEELL